MKEKGRGRRVKDPLARAIKILSVALFALALTACGTLPPVYRHSSVAVPNMSNTNGEVSSTDVLGAVQTASVTAPSGGAQIEACMRRMYAWLQAIQNLPAGFLPPGSYALRDLAVRIVSTVDRCTDAAISGSMMSQFGFGAGTFNGRFFKKGGKR